MWWGQLDGKQVSDENSGSTFHQEAWRPPMAYSHRDECEVRRGFGRANPQPKASWYGTEKQRSQSSSRASRQRGLTQDLYLLGGLDFQARWNIFISWRDANRWLYSFIYSFNQYSTMPVHQVANIQYSLPLSGASAVSDSGWWSWGRRAWGIDRQIVFLPWCRFLLIILQLVKVQGKEEEGHKGKASKV